jgi:hypothetical protein
MDTGVDIQKELGEKALGSIASILADVEQGVISPSEARVSIRAVFDSVSGLVSTEVFDMISEASESIRQGSGGQHSEQVALFRNKNGDLIRLARRWGEPCVHLYRMAPETTEPAWCKKYIREFSLDENPFKAAFDYYQAALKSLATNGFEEIK